MVGYELSLLSMAESKSGPEAIRNGFGDLSCFNSVAGGFLVEARWTTFQDIYSVSLIDPPD
jgi:hypothetical protein